MSDRIEAFFDYTCGFANRAGAWLDQLGEVEVVWRPFSLLEARREDDGPPVWERPEHADNISLQLLAGHQAVRANDGEVDTYRRLAQRAWHHTDERLTVDHVMTFAAQAGVDMAEANIEEALESVGQEYRAAEALGVFGSPTLVLPSGAAVFLRLRDVPPAGRAQAVLEAVRTVAEQAPEVQQLERAERREGT